MVYGSCGCSSVVRCLLRYLPFRYHPPQYQRLFDNDRWWVASKNLAVFGGMFIAITLVIGVTLAVFLDQRIRREGFIRTIYLYPMALSMIVTGTAWKWLLNPGL